MGHNRAGDNRRAKLKRSRREAQRLAAKEQSSTPTTKAVGLTTARHAGRRAAAKETAPRSSRERETEKGTAGKAVALPKKEKAAKAVGNKREAGEEPTEERR